jgi:hypothetical protein
MAQSLEQINQALNKLEQQAIDLSQKLHSAHQGYRNVLAQTAMEQTIMACFTLCTEAYPREFLKRSVADRHKLQTQIKAITQQMQQDLREVPSPDTPSRELLPPTPAFSLPEMLALPRASESDSDSELLVLDESDDDGDDDSFDEDDGFDADLDDDDLEPMDFDEDDAPSPQPRDRRDPNRDRRDDRNRQIEAELKALFSLESLLNRSPPLPDNPVDQVAFWHRYVEDQVTQRLRQVSSEINQALQAQKVLPAQIPAPILEAAALADGGETFGKTPHLMRMVLEAREKSQEDSQGDRAQGDRASRRRSRENSRPAAVINLVTLQLRLADLEFYDTNLISWRNQIRTLLKDLKTITKEYKRQQQQQAIANAKMAWRSTWSNE